jgi:hypothetical protein
MEETSLNFLCLVNIICTYWFLQTNGSGTFLYVHRVVFEQKYYDHHAS